VAAWPCASLNPDRTTSAHVEREITQRLNIKDPEAIAIEEIAGYRASAAASRRDDATTSF
jgi:hypothetical protein